MKGKFAFKTITFTLALCTALSGLTWAPIASAHCQIPCGIYGDANRFDTLREHITTLEKSMNQIVELSAEPGKNANQLVRWVQNKEEHANQFATIITEYFLQQRIKTNEADTEKYTKKLVACHKMLVHIMKAKQTTDLAHIKAARSLVDEFEGLYFNKEEKAHQHDHEGSGSDHK